MPQYSFQCRKCGTVFDIRASITGREAGLYPHCPACGSDETLQLITAPVLVHTNRGSDSGSCCGANPRRGCCG